MKQFVGSGIEQIKELMHSGMARLIIPRLIQKYWQMTLYPKFRALYGDFQFDEDFSEYAILNLPKESGGIRGEIVKAINNIPDPISRVLLPGKSNTVK